jgi:phosphatidylglycerophosphate synthase
MKKIKQIDLAVQIVAIFGGIIISATLGYTGKEFAFIYAYFIVGAVQLISFFGHLTAGSEIGLTPGRRNYGRFLVVLAILLALGFATGILLVLVLMGLLFVAPIVALLYCQMCYNELKLINHENKQ